MSSEAIEISHAENIMCSVKNIVLRIKMYMKRR